MIYGPDDEPPRTGPSKRQMEEDLRRAVLNTGGKLVVGAKAPPLTAPIVSPQPAKLRQIGKAEVAAPTPVRVTSVADIRYVEPIKFTGKIEPVLSAAPKLRMADPTVLRIEAAYQRGISRKSETLIRKIIGAWDWAKFKPPVCALTADGLFVIDGQHTAIAAASHPSIKEIPILIVDAAEIERRAEAFVSHNRDRIAMTPGQVFHGDVAAGNKAARAIIAAVERAGGSVPRTPISSLDAKPGQITAIEEIRSIYAKHGAETLERIVRIAVMSKLAPVGIVVARAIREVLTGDANKSLAKLPDSKIAGALAAIDNFPIAAATRAAGSGKGRAWGGAQLLAERLRAPR